MLDMRTNTQPTIKASTPPAPSLSLHDMDLTLKAVRGIADIEAGRCAPVAEVRARVLSRYEPSGACV